MEFLETLLWQDWIIAISQIVLSLALLPSIFSSHKPHPRTSVLTSVTLSILAYTFFTLDLWLSAAGTAVGALGWYILLFQKVLLPASHREDKTLER